jgi:hypothetical protein
MRREQPASASPLARHPAYLPGSDIELNSADFVPAEAIQKSVTRLNLYLWRWSGRLPTSPHVNHKRETRSMLFEEDDLRRLGKAFDRAWDRFLRTGMLNAANLQLSKEILARRILDAARVGEHDEWRLARDAFLYLWQVQFPELASTPIFATARAPSRSRRRKTR